MIIGDGTKKIGMAIVVMLILAISVIIFPSKIVIAGSYDGQDLALAILANESVFVNSYYTDSDSFGHRQSVVLSSLGVMSPTNGPTFALFSTGIAGNIPVTTDSANPGDERGSWFSGGKFGYPRDEVTLSMTLQVPPFMHYLYYDVQFLSAEYPEYVGTQYNDKLTITVNSPSQGTSEYIFDVNSGYFVLNSHGLTGTGFDIYAGSGYPGGIDWVDTTPRTPGADAGASDLVPIGGASHPVSPYEQITVTINLKDAYDNLADSAAYIDNLMFSGYAKTEIVARKTSQDINGGDVECDDIIRYSVTISNTGTADQHDNPGNEFEDIIPENSTFVYGSATSTLGSISYEAAGNKIIWNGDVDAESSVSLNFEVKINSSLSNGALLSNQGTVYWDSNEDGNNDKNELTDDPHIDDGIDQDLDGDTDDDDPTTLIVFAFETPSYVIEDFSDDCAGCGATQDYFGREWFNTSSGVLGSAFEVVDGYRYSTAKAFKSKLRLSGSPQYWYYNLSSLEGDINWWEIWFACGNVSEGSDLYLTFKNNAGNDIAKLKFEYVHMGYNPPVDWLLTLQYWSPSSNGWVQLYTDTYGFLYNGWYKIKIERKDPGFINYSLFKEDLGIVDFKTDINLGPPFSNLASVEWSSTLDSVVCPILFWDDHKIGL